MVVRQSHFLLEPLPGSNHVPVSSTCLFSVRWTPKPRSEGRSSVIRRLHLKGRTAFPTV